ncbi:MAG: response regulator [Thermoanaerobaculia bacterium]
MPKSILLADDSLTIQKVIELTFSDTDYELITVGNGLEAIASIHRSRPDLVMADVVMPGKNGYEVCETIKSTPALADIPVILLSGTFEPFDRERAERARANAIVTKPFDSKNLLTQVESLLTGRSSPTTVAVPVSPEPRAASAPDSPTAASSETVQIPTTPAPGSGAFRPPRIEKKSVAEIAEMTFDGATDFPEATASEPAGQTPPSDSDRGRKIEPVEFDMDDSSPFGKSASTAPFVQERPLHEVFSPFPEKDNVFEFPMADPSGAAPPETPARKPGPDDVTQEIPPIAPAAEDDFPPEPVFLQPAPKDPAPAPQQKREAVGPEIENLAQSATMSDLASLVSRVSPSAPLSDEDVDRVARKVVEMISDRTVREIAWEVVPDMAEIVVRRRLRELEAESGDSD